MKFAAACTLAVLSCAGLSAGAQIGVTPVQKVVQLLEGMAAKGKEEKHNEQVQFAAYKQFCDDTSTEKTREISEAEDTIGMLKATIEKAQTDAERLTREIAELDANVAGWDGDKKKALQVRADEKADYDKTHKDYSESIDALARAISVLKKQAYDRSQASLAQVSDVKKLNLIPATAKQALAAFLQDPPEAKGYEFHANSVIDMFEKLEDKFVDERTDLEKKEMNSKHNSALLVQNLEAQIAQATKERGEKAEEKANRMQRKADSSGDLTDTTATMEADKKYLSEMTATCQQKSADFQSRQQLRTEELEAISKAIEIISGNAVSGNADKHLPSLFQKPRNALAQLRSAGNDRAAQGRAAAFLMKESSRLSSRVLSTVASKVSDDPFVKVKKMIKDLIVRLMEEANEEAEHKGWCDTELTTNKQTRDEKSDSADTLRSEIDSLDSSITQLTSDIAELTEAVAKQDQEMATATSHRQSEKAENEQTIKDAGEAQTAVAQALTVLKDFYAKAGDANAFIQQQPVAPGIFDSPYKGMQSENGGVIGMLEVIQSDFARLEADTTAAEATAQKEYDNLMTISKVDTAQKKTDINHKTEKRQSEESALTTKKADLEGTLKELTAAQTYYDKLKPSCVDAGVSYESRVDRRKEEIKSLQEALRILNGEDIA